MTPSENIIHPKSKKLISELPPEGQKFIEDLAIECTKNGISLRIYDHSSYRKCVGEFSHDSKYLMVCTGDSDADFPYLWLWILIHESCHMDQWVEQATVYKKWYDGKNIEDWLAGEKWRKAEVTDTINKYQAVELDCEKRAVAKIDKYKLNYIINRDMYIKLANMQLYMIRSLQIFKKWPKSRKTKAWRRNMYSMMPPYFKRSYKEYPEGFLDEIKKILPD